MKIIDISRELFSAKVYPGDPAPKKEFVFRIDRGNKCNLTVFETGCHTATHLDAPLHFVPGGDTIDRFPLERFCGPCTVASVEGILTREQMEELLPRCKKILLLRGLGNAFLSEGAALAAAKAHLQLIGTDAQSIAPVGDETAPHRGVLNAGIPILEGLDLTKVKDGVYQLMALPLKIDGVEASLCRAVLLESDQ